MAHYLPAINLLSSLRSRTLIIPPVPLGTQGVMNKLKQLSRLSRSPMPKYSEQDPYLALLAYRSTPIDAHLCSPAEMLYLRVSRTTVPQRIRHKDPQAATDQDHLNDCATQSAAYRDCHCKPKSPLYAGQTVSVLWLPTTVINHAKHGSSLVQVIGGGQYRCSCDHICEHQMLSSQTCCQHWL